MLSLVAIALLGAVSPVQRAEQLYNQARYDGILFMPADEFLAFAKEAKAQDGSLCIDMAYVPAIDTFNNRDTLQFQIEDLRRSKR